MSQYIYLLQEREFIKTKENVYKVGMTKKENNKRFNQYPKGSVLLFQIICNNCNNMEKIILKKFKETFKQKKDIGNEYFEGDSKVMINMIYLSIKDEEQETKSDDDYSDDDYSDIEQERENKIKFNSLCEEICKIFPDYKNDESFGGNKKYIKISKIDNEYVAFYINPKLMNYLHYYYHNTESETIFDDYIINQYLIDDNVVDELQYFNHLINKKLVCVDTIYDINSTKFISKIDKTKFYIKIENYDDFRINLTKSDKEIYCKIREKIRQLFHCNTIINTCLYSTIVKNDELDNIFIFKKLKDFNNFRIDIGTYHCNIITLYKINSKYYDCITFLRKYIPYCIRWDINNNYYILNRDYEYIGLNTKSIGDYTGCLYLFNDGNKPWNNKNNYIRMCNQYKKIINDNSLKECLNMHNSTETMLTLLN